MSHYNQTLEDKMKSLDESPGGESDGENNGQHQEHQSLTSHNMSPLLSNQWKPFRRHRAIVKGQSEVKNHSNLISTDQINPSERSYSVIIFIMHVLLLKNKNHK